MNTADLHDLSRCWGEAELTEVILDFVGRYGRLPHRIEIDAALVQLVATTDFIEAAQSELATANQLRLAYRPRAVTCIPS